jgi:hypothetical protein
MGDKQVLTQIHLDYQSNRPKNDESRDQIKQIRRKAFEDNLTSAVERTWDLPPEMVFTQRGEFLELLCEARELYIVGHFYPCVAMCGIVGERLVKDVLRESVLVVDGESLQRPSEKAFNQLEYVDVSSIVRFLKETDLLSAEAVTASEKLITLRNKYAHARGKSPQNDALKAVGYLHTLVEGTVSVFKEHEIKNGVLIRKADM